MNELFFKLKSHLEELFGGITGLLSGIYHIIQHQSLHIIEGVIYTVIISFFGVLAGHYSKKFVKWLDK